MIQSVKPELVSRYEWHYIDMEEYVKSLFGQEYEAAAALGFPSQDTYWDFDVTGGIVEEGINAEGEKKFGRWMDEQNTLEDAVKLIEAFKVDGMPREEYADPSVELMLNWLAYEGHIPTGNYRIIVWW
ncbi:hypothetical protein SEA_BOOMERJR_223 [Streptomyces phage BoomerJR]|uniref:Uncharacterized protein n=1 Tax=Streptomyces phage BoomerJR TaxID=2502449 RepID=A0A411CG28_9CAUD|nr:hypothetical protein SEA_BOOMERJR_223 [Streptomyces phage BoomerJR]UVD40029.1 hypothetical protein SEA_STANIMAL_223 [Streptomyces phage Stanimal]